MCYHYFRNEQFLNSFFAIGLEKFFVNNSHEMILNKYEDTKLLYK